MESGDVKLALSPAHHNSVADQFSQRFVRVIAGPFNDVVCIQQHLSISQYFSAR